MPLSRKKDYRNNLIRNLATSLILYEEIRTTKAKAKALKPVVEHLIAFSKPNDLTARRRLLSFLFDENAVKKVLEVLVPRYQKVNSGFIRTYKLGHRVGDGAEVVVLKLVPATKEAAEENIKGKQDKVKDATQTKKTGRKVIAKSAEKPAASGKSKTSK